MKDLSATEKSLEQAKGKYEKERKKQSEVKDEYEKAAFNLKLKEKLSKTLQVMFFVLLCVL